MSTEKVVSLRPGELIITREMEMAMAIEGNVETLQNTHSTVLTLIAGRHEASGLISDEDIDRVLWVVANLLEGAIASLERAREREGAGDD